MKNLILVFSIFATINITASEVITNNNHFDFEEAVKLFVDLTVNLEDYQIKGINAALVNDDANLLNAVLINFAKSTKEKYDSVIDKLREEILCKAILYESIKIIKFLADRVNLELENLESPRNLYLPIVLSGLMRNEEITKKLILAGATFGMTEISKNLEKIGVSSTEIQEICEFVRNCVYETGLISRKSDICFYDEDIKQ